MSLNNLRICDYFRPYRFSKSIRSNNLRGGFAIAQNPEGFENLRGFLLYGGSCKPDPDIHRYALADAADPNEPGLLYYARQIAHIFLLPL